MATNDWDHAGGDVSRQAAEDSGFTLIELTFVIGVMAILFALSVPAYSKFAASSRLAGIRNTLMVDMRYARALASARHRTYEIWRTTTGYSLVGLSPTATVLTRIMPSDVRFSSADSTTFYPWGLTEPAAVTIRQGARTTVVRLTSAGQVSHD